MHTVTRQLQWPDGDTVVEISQGGIDYTNPDALAEKYPGEFEEFEDPREAVKTAIKIAQQWQKDCPDKTILIDHGATAGMTMPFDGMDLVEENLTELRTWADELVEKLPKCDKCGETIFGKPIELADFDDWKFCREYCAEEWYNEQFAEEEEYEEC